MQVSQKKYLNKIFQQQGRLAICNPFVVRENKVTTKLVIAFDESSEWQEKLLNERLEQIQTKRTDLFSVLF